MATAVELASIYCIAALGVLLTSVVVEFFDLTVDGAFTLGAAVASVTLRSGDYSVFGILCAVLAGSFAGLLTACVWRLGIQPLLSGILVMFALYSLNLHIMGSSNVSLADSPRLLPLNALPFLVAIAVCVCVAVWLLLLTPSGAQMRALPRSSAFLQSIGVSPLVPVVVALAVSNGLAALAGAIMAQLQGYADITMGDGTLVFSLASIILGRAVLRQRQRPGAIVLAVLLGSMAYQFVIYGALRAGVPPVELRVLTAALVVIVLVVSRAGDGLVRNRAAARR